MGRETVAETTARPMHSHVAVGRKSLLFHVVDRLGTEVVVVRGGVLLVRLDAAKLACEQRQIKDLKYFLRIIKNNNI